MKRFVLATAIGLLAATGALADPIVGTWRVAPKDAEGSLHVKISACGGAFCGKIAKAFNAQGESTGDYEHLGKPMIKNMKANGDGTYSGGTIWAPDTNKTYKSKMNFEGSVLVVRGCVAGGVICREGGRWKKVN